MIVWPEKADEWVALIGGIVGTLLGLSSVLLTLLNYRRDNARLRLVAGDDMGEHAHRRLYLSITNIGRRPIHISMPWIFWKNTHGETPSNRTAKSRSSSPSISNTSSSSRVRSR